MIPNRATHHSKPIAKALNTLQQEHPQPQPAFEKTLINEKPHVIHSTFLMIKERISEKSNDKNQG